MGAFNPVRFRSNRTIWGAASAFEDDVIDEHDETEDENYLRHFMENAPRVQPYATNVECDRGTGDVTILLQSYAWTMPMAVRLTVEDLTQIRTRVETARRKAGW